MKRPYLLIGVLLIATSIVLLALLYSGKTKQPMQMTTTPTVLPTPVANSMLYFSPDSISLNLSESTPVEIRINSGYNQVTAVQLELKYDPAVFEDVQLREGTFFPTSFVLFNNTDKKSGKISYALGIPPGQSPVSGTGTVAVLSLVKYKKISPVTQTIISLQPTSLVTAAGVDSSVLKQTGILALTGNGGM